MTKEESRKLNSHDQEILNKLQDLLGGGLKQAKSCQYNMPGYAINKAGAVVRLGLHNCKIDDKKLDTIAQMLTELMSLTALDLSSNQLTDVSGLASLTNLNELVLRENKLSDISPLSSLTSLTFLDLCNNELKNIPPEFFKRDWEVHYKEEHCSGGLNLYDNPLETPPLEIIKQGKKVTMRYIDSFENTVNLYEAKLLVVGPGDVGKTSLSNRLIYGKTPPTKSTEGIDIHKWIVDTKGIKGFRINLWDFGGQEIYQATHQFFLTKRSLYLYVWHARGDDDRVSFGYWLNVIKLLSDGAPVIMVMNKCDERRKPIDQVAIQKQFDNVIGFYEVSAKENIGIDELRTRVTEEIEKLEQIGTTLPKQWVDIREQLEGMKEDDKKYITYKAYQDICTGYKFNEKQADYLAGYYHELGVILHFADNPVLRDIVFLNPEWATNAVYAVTDSKPVKEKYGRFHFDQLKGIWKDYPEDKYAALLELMAKFELCFNLEGTKEYIIPELLRPERCSFEWSYQDNLHFQYKYDFMPVGIITRFMVRKQDLIKDDLYWKNGMAMEWEGTEARIESNEFEGKIDIWIRGEDKKGMLAIIRCDIEHIHETLNRPVVAERIPCICSKCENSTEPHFYNYHDLRTLLRKNVRSTRCMKSAEEISIDVLLGSYGIKKEFDEDMHWSKNIYINNDTFSDGPKASHSIMSVSEFDYKKRMHIKQVNKKEEEINNKSLRKAVSFCDQAKNGEGTDEQIMLFEKARKEEDCCLEAWKRLEGLYRKKGDQIKQKQAYERINEIEEVLRFENNVDQQFMLTGLETNGLNFLGDMDWRFESNINILLGRNGYGKTFLLRMIAAMLKNDRNCINNYFTNKVKDKTAFIELTTTGKEKKEEVIRNETGFFDSSFGEIPILAFPDLRHIDRSKINIENKEVDSVHNVNKLRYYGSYHFLNNMSMDGIIETFLYDICQEYLKERTFDLPIFKLISEVFETLTDEGIEFKEVKTPLGESGCILYVKTEGNNMPLPIQRVSQGTLSVMAIFGMIYYFLRLLYNNSDDKIIEQPAIVLIDELDAHLHPGWQQKIIGLLREIFPNIQFIITAHSPMIVAGCYENEVAVLCESGNRFTVKQLAQNFIGMEVEDILKLVFMVEDKDENYLYYNANRPFKGELESEVEILNKKMKTDDWTDEDLILLQEKCKELKYIDNVQLQTELRRREDELSIENRMLKARLKKMECDE